MARDQAQVTCPPGVWTELTNDDVTEITFQVISGSVKVRCTTGSAPSALSDAGYVYHARAADSQEESGELRVAITDLTATAGADRVFATPINGRPAKVVVDHA
jgi:hypothetical protein